MDANSGRVTDAPLSPRDWGQIEIIPAPIDCPFQGMGAVEVVIYRWIPRVEVRTLFPPGHLLDFWCIRGVDGFRRLLPVTAVKSGCGAFLVNSAASGMAFIERPWQNATPEVRSNNCNYYRFRQLIYQWSSSEKRSLNRELTRLEDLRLRSNERPDISISTIVPEWAFWNQTNVPEETRSQDEQMTLFVEAARSEAARCGRPAVAETDLINLGIIGLARNDPFAVIGSTNARLLTLIRKSVWEDYGPDLEFNSDIKNEVEGRLWDSFRKHNHLSTDAFHEWFFKDIDNLIGQISKRKRNNHSISRDQVNQALGELVWESFQVTSKLAAHQMRWFKAVLPEALCSEEELWFNALYETKAQYGGLIPLMLHSRFKLFHPLMLELLSIRSDGSSEAALVTSILMHAEMVKARRDADTRSKNNTGRNRARHQASIPSYVEPVEICDQNEEEEREEQ
ncbi:MAG: hypothetical protein JWM11_6280 [Planctomycetaceae bacterium]|nr:hypothetical protein [Planctomycetaceae bacterium]